MAAHLLINARVKYVYVSRSVFLRLWPFAAASVKVTRHSSTRLLHAHDRRWLVSVLYPHMYMHELHGDCDHRLAKVISWL